jgi:branched-chain amino acid transport system ATP-binding protein
VALALRNVVAGYGSTTVLRDVTITLPAGSVVALLGANGAGKTTLLRVASGLVRPASGQITVDETRLTGRPPHEFAQHGVCHVPEGRSIFRTMTVRDNLLLQARRGDEVDGLARAVEAFPVLGQRLDQVASTLSGGEQQMLAMCRSYLADARFILLDEVSLGLAPRVVDEIYAFFGRLTEGGASLLIVEQYVARALRLADYVYVLNRGRMAFVGEPAEVQTSAVFSAYVGT